MWCDVASCCRSFSLFIRTTIVFLVFFSWNCLSISHGIRHFTSLPLHLLVFLLFLHLLSHCPSPPRPSAVCICYNDFLIPLHIKSYLDLFQDNRRVKGGHLLVPSNDSFKYVQLCGRSAPEKQTERVLIIYSAPEMNSLLYAHSNCMFISSL